MVNINDMKYNVPVEVTKNQYFKVIVEFAGVIAHRIDDDGRYWIKLWWPKYKKELITFLNKIK